MSAHVDMKNVMLSAQALLGNTKRNRLSVFRRDENGSILIFSLFLLIMMLMISGMAVDLMRSETQRARLQSTLDRAVLAGASLDQVLDSETVVRDYFEKAGLESYLTSVTVVEGDNKKTVTASADMQMNTLFMKLMGIDELTAPANGEAEESLSNIEISLIVDVSGSMGWNSSSGNSKLYDLQEAAKEFVYMMQCNPDDPTGTAACTVEDDTVSISLVPYSEQVLVGETLFSQFNVSNEHTNSSCADFELADFSSVSIPLYSTDTSVDIVNRSAEIDNRTNYRSSRSTSHWAKDSSRSCRVASYREIMPLSNSYTDLQTKIDTLQANGNTSIDLGMKWGTALLDPSFRPATVALSSGGSPMISPEFADRPYEYNARSMQKVIVLMTDGENTTQYSVRDSHRSGMSGVWRDPDDGDLSAYRASYDKYKYLSDGNYHDDPDGGSDNDAVELTYAEFWEDYNVDFFEEAFSFLPDPTTSAGYSTKNTRLDAICSAAKAQDIEVFTIGFETSSSSNAIMKSCASSDSHHFDVDGLNLDDAFASIAREIHELRLIN